MAMKFVDHLAKRGNAARQIAQQIELVAVVHAKIGIDMPDQDSIDGANAALGVGQKAVDGIFAGLRIVKRPVPDEQLHLRKNMLSPG